MKSNEPRHHRLRTRIVPDIKKYNRSKEKKNILSEIKMYPCSAYAFEQDYLNEDSNE